MSAVKVFFSAKHQALHDELQGWLDHSEVVIQGVTMDSNDYGHCLVVLHEPGSGHRYHAQIFYATRHHDLEQQANEALASAPRGGAQVVAVGSNQYGHCLCVIREL